MTLINFVASVIETKFSEALIFKEELECCEDASKGMKEKKIKIKQNKVNAIKNK